MIPQKFLDAVASVVEVEKVGLDDAFRDYPGWCSLQGFGLLVMLENDWGTPLDVMKFQRLKTVRDLFREAFLAFAAQIFGVPRSMLSPETAYGSLPAWDSVAHLRLVMEAENRFGSYYPIETIPALKRLEDFCR